ncbi:MAG: hypothetical protein RLZZ524_756 [Pseudomonadota bacterium]
MTQAICDDCPAPTACRMTRCCARGRTELTNVGDKGTIDLSNMVDYEVWQPTLELRYIRRETKPGWFVTTLQQRWERLSPCVGSAWHDIPTVTEEEQG